MTELISEIDRRLNTVRRQRLDGWIHRADELEGLRSAAIAIDAAAAGETEGLDPQGKSAAPQGDRPTLGATPTNRKDER